MASYALGKSRYIMTYTETQSEKETNKKMRDIHITTQEQTKSQCDYKLQQYIL